MKKFLLVFVVAGLALAGCGGSSAKDTGSGGSGGGSGDAFSQLLEKQSKANIRVTYKDDDSEFTVSQNGQGKVAYIKGDEHIIKDGDKVTRCTDLDGQPTCEDIPSSLSAGVLSAYTAVFSLANTWLTAAKQAKGFGDESSETIAGRSAECVTITPASISGIAGQIAGKLGGDAADKGVKVCADKDTGVFLLWQPVGVDTDQVLEAIEVGEPEASDFEVPANAITPGDSTTDNSTDTSTDDSTTETSAPDDENCTRMTLPGGVTMPAGITLPCER